MAFSEETALAAVTTRLRARCPELPVEVVEEAVRNARARFEDRPVRDFIPILVERVATQTLRGGGLQLGTEHVTTPAALSSDHVDRELTGTV